MWDKPGEFEPTGFGNPLQNQHIGSAAVALERSLFCCLVKHLHVFRVEKLLQVHAGC